MSDTTLVPVLGTVVDLSKPAEIATALRDVREAKRVLDQWRIEFEERLAEEAARQGSKTLRYGDVTVKVSSDTEIQWDLAVLRELREAGLPEERYKELVATTITYKVSSTVAKQLEGANPAYAEIVQRARSRYPGRTRVSVS